MEDAIIEKLRRLLDRGIGSEADLVYLLVQIRKLYERRGVELAPYLGMFCDWVAHPWLSNPSWGRLALETMGTRPRITQYEFQTALAECLQGEGLQQPNWTDAWSHLACVLKDCPVVFSEGDNWFKFKVAPIPGCDSWAVSLKLLTNLPSNLPQKRREAAAVIAKL